MYKTLEYHKPRSISLPCVSCSSLNLSPRIPSLTATLYSVAVVFLVASQVMRERAVTSGVASVAELAWRSCLSSVRNRSISSFGPDYRHLRIFLQLLLNNSSRSCLAHSMAHSGPNGQQDGQGNSPKRKRSGEAASQYQGRERSTSPIPSPGSSEPHARRGRSRTRNPPQSTPPKHQDDHERRYVTRAITDVSWRCS